MVQRYDIRSLDFVGTEARPDPSGQWVKHTDFAALLKDYRMLVKAHEAMRDAVLHQRGAMAENGMTNDQVNDVLGEIDDAFNEALRNAGQWEE